MCFTLPSKTEWCWIRCRRGFLFSFFVYLRCAFSNRSGFYRCVRTRATYRTNQYKRSLTNRLLLGRYRTLSSQTYFSRQFLAFLLPSSCVYALATRDAQVSRNFVFFSLADVRVILSWVISWFSMKIFYSPMPAKISRHTCYEFLGCVVYYCISSISQDWNLFTGPLFKPSNFQFFVFLLKVSSYGRALNSYKKII